MFHTPKIYLSKLVGEHDIGCDAAGSMKFLHVPYNCQGQSLKAGVKFDQMLYFTQEFKAPRVFLEVIHQ